MSDECERWDFCQNGSIMPDVFFGTEFVGKVAVAAKPQWCRPMGEVVSRKREVKHASVGDGKADITWVLTNKKTYHE